MSLSEQFTDRTAETERHSQDPYLVEAARTPLLSAQEEKECAVRIAAGNRAFMAAMESLRAIMKEHAHEPSVQAFFSEVKKNCPHDVVAMASELHADLQWSAESEQANGDTFLLHAAVDLAKQKIHLQNTLAISYSQERSDIIRKLLRIVKIVEEKGIAAGMSVADPSAKESLEAKIAVAGHAERSRNTLRAANLRLVASWARKFLGRGLPFYDLVEEGNMGLMRSVENFDHQRGLKFSTYASWWIQQSLFRAVAVHAHDIRVPPHVHDVLHDFRKKKTALEIRDKRTYSIDQAAQMLDINPDELQTLKLGMRAAGAKSLDYEYESDKGGNSLVKALTDESAPLPDFDMEEDAETDEQLNYFETLDGLLATMVQNGEMETRDADIIRMRLGIGQNTEAAAMEDVGKAMDVSREYIRHLQARAVGKLEATLAIRFVEQQASNTGKNINARYATILAFIERRQNVGHGRKRRWTPEKKTQVHAFLDAVLNRQQADVMKWRLGVEGNGGVGAYEDIATALGLTYVEVIHIEAASMEWLRASVQSDRTIRSPDFQTVTEENRKDAHGYGRFKKIFELIDAGKEQEEDAEKKVTSPDVRQSVPRVEAGNISYFTAMDGILDLDPIFRARRGRGAQKDALASLVQDEEAPDETVAFREKLFADSPTDAELETRHDRFPLWMRAFNEATATRLHTLLLGHPTELEMQEFLSKAQPETRRAHIEKIATYCMTFTEGVSKKLREWVLELDAKKITPAAGQYIRSSTFLHVAEADKIVIPNLRTIIRRHFETSDKPLQDRSILVMDGHAYAQGLANAFGTIDHMHLKDLRKVLGMPAAHAHHPADVVVLNFLTETMRFEEDEKALLWAQSLLSRGGICISIFHDKVAEPGSRAHFRKQMRIRERTRAAPRFMELLSRRGYAVEGGRATLSIQADSPDAMPAMRDILSYTLPSREGVDDALLDTYIQQHVQTADGPSVFHESIYFVIGHENPVANRTMSTQDVSREPMMHADEQDADLFDLLRKDQSNVTMTGEQPAEEMGFWRGLELLQEELPASEEDWTAENKAASATEPPKTKKLSYERKHVQGSIEFQRLRGKLIRLLHGRKYRFGQQNFEQPIFPKTKKMWRREARQYNPKITKRLGDTIADLNRRLIEMQMENPYAVDPKTGEIMIDGALCVQLKPFARIHDFDLPTIVDTIHALNIQPAGWALRMDSEEVALAMGYQTPVYALEELRQIPYIRERLGDQTWALQEPWTEASPPAARDRKSTFLRELDAELEADGTTLQAMLGDMRAAYQQDLARASSGDTVTMTRQEIDHEKTLQHLFTVLTEQEATVITARFGLRGMDGQSLQEIGNDMGITRQRASQLAMQALHALQDVVESSPLSRVNASGKKILQERGGMLLETALIDAMAKIFPQQSSRERSMFAFSFSLDSGLARFKCGTGEYAWRLSHISDTCIGNILNACTEHLRREGCCIPTQQFLKDIAALAPEDGESWNRELIRSCLDMHPDMKETPEGWGLAEWPFITPKNIGDKIEIVLRRHSGPLHFYDIVTQVEELSLDDKDVKEGNIRHGLIRDPRFAVVGQGKYALTEQGYIDGKTGDVIKRILSDQGPLERERLIEEIQKHRFIQRPSILAQLKKLSPMLDINGSTYALAKEIPTSS